MSDQNESPNPSLSGPDDRLLSSTEVAALFRVSARTVTDWASSGRLRSVRTPGGHHRFTVAAVRAALAGEPPEIDLTDRATRQARADRDGVTGRS